jgi:hypothetical protein
LLFVWATGSADGIKKPGKPEKPYSVSIGLYAENFSRSSVSGDADFSGYALAIGQVFRDNIDGRITVYSSENDNLSSLDSRGYDIVLHYGTGLASQGFKAYIGGGYFKDIWELSDFKESFSGLQISGGVGYNWNLISLDFVLAIRDPDDFEKLINKVLGTDISVDAYSGSLLLSYRF